MFGNGFEICVGNVEKMLVSKRNFKRRENVNVWKMCWKCWIDVAEVEEKCENMQKISRNVKKILGIIKRFWKCVWNKDRMLKMLEKSYEILKIILKMKIEI